VKLKDTHLIRLPHGADLLEVLTEQCEQRNIRLGYVSIIGSVKEATIGYYDQKTRIYQNKQVSGGLEITSCTGNISLSSSIWVITTILSKSSWMEFMASTNLSLPVLS